MAWPSFDTAQWVCALLAALCVGLAKAGFSGVGMPAILLMAQVLPARESTGAILPLLILGDVFAVRAYHRHANGRLVLRLIPAALTGIVCGWLLMRAPLIPAKSFGHLIGWITLVLTLLVIVQMFVPAIVHFAVQRPKLAWPFGWLAGSTTMLANAAGPVMSMYLLTCRLPKMEFVGTAAWFFFAVNVIKIPFSASMGLINFSSLSLNLYLAPVVIIGLFSGKWLLHKINQSVFEWSMIVLSLLGALRLLLA